MNVMIVEGFSAGATLQLVCVLLAVRAFDRVIVALMLLRKNRKEGVTS